MLSAVAVKSRAHELGFDLCGIAPAEAFPELQRLRTWIDRGYAGEMRYLARTLEKRSDPRAVLASARSIIITATVYDTDRPPSVSRPAREARISRYAWGEDYHEVLARRLHLLLGWMRVEAGHPFEAVAYVDTGPVQEKAIAALAGLGWIGKNTCLINEQLGSWLFLAEILCSVPLAPDAPALDRCGSCTRCIETCPTHALDEPYVLDATRCISYLTIELKEGIAADLRSGVGTQVYGCDICQDVCPWNRRPVGTADPVWAPRPGLDNPALADLWRKSDAELACLMTESAMRRAGVRGLRRNLAVALGNSRDDEARAALVEDRDPAQAASVADPMVAEHVRWARARVTG